MNEANDKGHAKVFIFKTEYGYAVTPSPVVVPTNATLEFLNLSRVTATLSIPGAKPPKLEVGPGAS
ncbi:MAG TPA: hypothetical protein VF948_13095, partial [Methylomirabilota bacterium]